MKSILKATATYMERLAGRLALILVVPAASLWMILTVWFSNLPESVFPAVATVAVGVVILA